EENLELRDARFDKPIEHRGGQFVVGVNQDLARRHVDDIGRYERALQIVRRNLHLLNLGLLNLLHQRGGDLPALRYHRLALCCDRVRKLQPREPGRDRPVGMVQVPEQLVVLDRDAVDIIERAQNLLIRFQTESAQKNGTVELTLAVDPDVENVLVVVLELHPASAIRNDLAKKISLRRNTLEKHTRRAMQLRNEHALGAVDDERSVVRHQ